MKWQGKPAAVLALILLLSAAALVLIAAKPHAAPAPFDRQVEQWIEQLSAEDGFTSWKEASWRKYPLGPGQHGWVVIVSGANGEEVGYLIVSETPHSGEYVLIEYGVGGLPLFSAASLERALQSGTLQEEGIEFTSQAKAERLFFGGALALWKVSEHGITRYAEAKTGLWLPIDENDVAEEMAREQMGKSALSGKEIFNETLHILIEPTDPYMSLSWLDEPEADIRDWESFRRWWEKSEEKMYALRAFGGKALTPLGVAGVHAWPASDESGCHPFVAVEQEGLRYIPLERLLQDGTFH